MPLIDYLDEKFLKETHGDYITEGVLHGRAFAQTSHARREESKQVKGNFFRVIDDIARSRQQTENILKQGVCAAKIIARNPNAWKIPVTVGIPGYSPKSSSSNRAVAFASAGNILSSNQDDRGSLRGAFRHVLWQSDIGSKYSDSIAKQIGDCHEMQRPFNPDLTIFSTLDEADSAVDQLNNITGRQIGRNFGNLTTKQRAMKVLEKAYVEGLHTVEKTPYGSYKVVKSKLDFNTYERMRTQLQTLDEDGLPRDR